MPMYFSNIFSLGTAPLAERCFISASLVLLSSCALNQPPMAEFNLAFGSNAEITVEHFTLSNGTEFISTSGGGSIGSGWSYNSLPENGKSHVLSGRNIVPQTAHARWFSYQNQRFYEADLVFSKNLPNRLVEFSTAFEENTYKPSIVIGFGKDGEIMASLKTSCSYFQACGDNKKIILIASGQGRETSGDPRIYHRNTILRIQRGLIKPLHEFTE
jgi:hypothetical protein